MVTIYGVNRSNTGKYDEEKYVGTTEGVKSHIFILEG